MEKKKNKMIKEQGSKLCRVLNQLLQVNASLKQEEDGGKRK